MSYKDKVIKDRAFKMALANLLQFAHSEPVLDINKRRAIVAAIYFGEETKNKTNKEKPYFALSYQRTQNGLLRACAEKMWNYPQQAPAVRQAIMKLSALSAWAKSTPNRCLNIFEDFSAQMVPEDAVASSDKSPTELTIQKLRSNWGIIKLWDLTDATSNRWHKKYKER